MNPEYVITICVRVPAVWYDSEGATQFSIESRAAHDVLRRLAEPQFHVSVLDPPLDELIAERNRYRSALKSIVAACSAGREWPEIFLEVCKKAEDALHGP